MAQTQLDFLTQLKNLPNINSSTYNFSAQSPGGTLTNAITNTVTLAPVPEGVNGADTNHWLRITGGVGTSEVVLITGGTAVAGSSTGTITFVPANSHSGAWTIGSATAGIQEANNHISTNTFSTSIGQITIPVGSFTIYGPIRINNPLTIKGSGRKGTVLNIATTFSTSADGVFIYAVDGSNYQVAGNIQDLTIHFNQADSTSIGDMIHYPAAINFTTGSHLHVSNVIIELAWNGIVATSAINGVTLENVGLSIFNVGINVQDSYDSTILNNVHIWLYGATTNQVTALQSATSTGFYLGHLDDCKMTNCTSVTGSFGAVIFKGGALNGPPAVFITDCWFDGFGTSSGSGNISISDAAYVSITSTYILGTGSSASISIAGGSTVDLTKVIINNNGSGIGVRFIANATISSGATAGVPSLSITDCEIRQGSTDVNTIYLDTDTPYTGILPVMINRLKIFKTSTIAYLNPVITALADTQLDIENLFVTPLTSGSGVVLNLAADTYHFYTKINAKNYTITDPSTKVNLYRWGNESVTGAVNSTGKPTKIAAKLTSSTFVPLQTENYIASETGSNNAIAVALADADGVNVPQANGLKLAIKLGHSLQAGANTIALNGASAVALKSGRNPSNNIGTAYAATGTINVVYDSTGPYYLDISQ